MTSYGFLLDVNESAFRNEKYQHTDELLWKRMKNVFHDQHL